MQSSETNLWRIFKTKGVYVFFSVFLVFLAATLLLELLERLEIIDTRRLDDHSLFAPVGFLKKVKTDEGLQFQIHDPSMMDHRFPVKKEKEAFRIVLTGGSFAAGVPAVIQSPLQEVPPGMIAMWLDAELSARYPKHRIEVINAAVLGLNSFGVYEIAQTMTSVKPDLLIVASGNNECDLPITPVNRPMNRWIIWRVLKKIIHPEVPLEKRPMYFITDTDKELVAAAYYANMEKIIGLCRKANIPLALSTLPINISGLLFDEPKSPDIPDRFFAAGKYEEALQTYLSSPRSGFVDFRIGTCYQALGKYAEAKKYFLSAASQSTGGHIRPEFNNWIRKKTKEDNLLLIDLDDRVTRLSPHGITDRELFVDLCHMNWVGYYLMGQFMSDTISEAKMIGSDALPSPTFNQLVKQIQVSDLLGSDEYQTLGRYLGRLTEKIPEQ